MTIRFGAGARLFHWLVVALLLVQIPAGIAMIAPALKQESIDQLFVLHKGLGVVLLVVVVARSLWRLTHRILTRTYRDSTSATPSRVLSCCLTGR